MPRAPRNQNDRRFHREAQSGMPCSMRFFLSSGGAGARAGFGAGGLDAARGLIADQFAPVLARLGEVVRVDTPAEGVRLAREGGAVEAGADEAGAGEATAVHVCLALPHELPPEAGAETVAAFGLSLATCPDTPFAGDPRTDWRLRLGCSGGALVFSTHAARAVRALMGDTCPVLTAMPPVACNPEPAPPAPATLSLTGAVLDTSDWPKTAPPDRAAWLSGEAATLAADADGPPQAMEANPPPAKTLRYRLGVTRLHLAYLYREVVRDTLPRPVATAVSRAGRLGVRVARRLVVGRDRAPSALPPADLDFFPPPPTGEEAGLWRPGTSRVALDGFVCAAVHGGWDRSWGELLSAWVEVCGGDALATLVVKTAGLDQDTRNNLAGTLRRLGPFACRVVILDGALEGGLDALVGASAFYLCASASEAAPLPLLHFLAAGRPAVSPDHSALADLIDADTSFVVASGLEYESWPGDVEERLAATGWRLDWESLCAGIASARALWRQADAYAEMARAVARRTELVCGPDVVEAALRSLGQKAAHPRPRRTGGRPVILVHSETDAGTLATRLGTAEYSYFFVLRFFRPVLERIGRVVPVADPAREVDRLHAQAVARGEPCVFLSFSPPHRTPTGFACPTVPVFAWEFDTIPQEHWGGERRHDWARVLQTLGCAIVHSQATVDTVRGALGEGFPVWSIPAPVWDAFAPESGQVPLREAKLSVRGTVLDTSSIPMAGLRHDENWVERVHAERAQRGQICEVSLDGVVYSSVFNPEDGRKNWPDMLAAFCRVFAGETRATLVLKLTHHDGTWGMALMLKHLRRLMPFACRVVLIHGYLPDADYARLVAVTTYTVNTSHGEGQCLPLMEAMSAGKPAVAPAHTGMADYLDESCAFLVGHSAEPACWPQDSRLAIRTHRRRIDLETLEAAYRESFVVATQEPALYDAMSEAAVDRLRQHCSADVVERKLREFLDAKFQPDEISASVIRDMSLESAH